MIWELVKITKNNAPNFFISIRSDKLRVIILLEAYFNFINKLYFERTLVHRVEES